MLRSGFHRKENTKQVFLYYQETLFLGNPLCWVTPFSAFPYTWFHPKRSSSHHHIILMVPWSHAYSLILHVIVPSFDLKHLFYSSMSHHIRISIIQYQTSSSFLPNTASKFSFQCPSYLVIHAWLASLGSSQALARITQLYLCDYSKYSLSVTTTQCTKTPMHSSVCGSF